MNLFGIFTAAENRLQFFPFRCQYVLRFSFMPSKVSISIISSTTTTTSSTSTTAPSIVTTIYYLKWVILWSLHQKFKITFPRKRFAEGNFLFVRLKSYKIFILFKITFQTKANTCCLHRQLSREEY